MTCSVSLKPLYHVFLIKLWEFVEENNTGTIINRKVGPNFLVFVPLVGETICFDSSEGTCFFHFNTLSVVIRCNRRTIPGTVALQLQVRSAGSSVKGKYLLHTRSEIPHPIISTVRFKPTTNPSLITDVAKLSSIGASQKSSIA